MADLPESLSTADTRADHITHHQTLHALHNLFDLAAANTGDVLTWDGVDWVASPPTSGASGEYAFTNILHVRPSGSDSNSGLTWADAKATIAAAVAAGADVVHLSPGRHAVASPITLTSPVRFVGPDTGALYEDYDAATASIRTVSGAVASYFVDQAGSTFTNVTFELGSDTQPMLSTAAVVGQASGVSMTSCRLMRSPDAATESFFYPVYLLSTVDASDVTMFDCHVRSASLASIGSSAAVVTGTRIEHVSGVAIGTPSIPWLNLGSQRSLRLDRAAVLSWGGVGTEVVYADRLAGSHISGLACRNLLTPYKALDLVGCINTLVEYATGPGDSNGYVFQDAGRVDQKTGFSWGHWYDASTHNSLLMAGPQTVTVEPPPPPPPPPGDSPAALPNFATYPLVPSSYVSATPSNWQTVIASGANVVLENGTYTGGQLRPLPGQTIMARNPLQAVFNGNGTTAGLMPRVGANGARLWGIKAVDYSNIGNQTWTQNLPPTIDLWSSSNFELGWCDIGETDHRGVQLNGYSYMHDCYIHDCGEFGWNSGWNLTVERVEAWNCGMNTPYNVPTGDKGLMKLALTTNTFFYDLTIHQCRIGPWWDIENVNANLDRAYIYDIPRMALFWEISYGPASFKNILINNAAYDPPVYYDGAEPPAVLISMSPEATFENITVQGVAQSGFGAKAWNHPNKSPDWTRLGLDNIRVINCHVEGIKTGGMAYGTYGTYQSGTLPTDVIFQDCTYSSGDLRAGLSGTQFINVQKV